MATRMFLRDTTDNTAGYVATELSTALPAGTANLGGNVAHDLSTTAGTVVFGPVSLASLAQTAHQDGYYRKFISAPLTGVTSITAQTWTCGWGCSEGNASANTFAVFSVYVLKSDDTVRGYVYDDDTPLGTEWTTTTQGRVVTFTGAAVSAVEATDRLVLEFWYHSVQAMAASYANNISYNGSTDIVDGVNNNDGRSFLETPQDGLFDAGGGAQNLAGVLFTKAPTFPAGAITGLYGLTGTLFTAAPTFNTGAITAGNDLAGVLYQNTPTFPQGAITAGAVNLAGVLFVKAPTFPTGNIETAGGTQNLTGSLFTATPTFPQGAVTSANWADTVIVPPTGSSGLGAGSFADVDERPPWNDTDTASEAVASLGTGAAIFSGFDLSLAGGEKKGFRIWSRMRASNVEGFDVTIVLKQDTTILWTSPTFTLTNTALLTFVIPIPDSAFATNPDIDNLSLEWTYQNLRSASNTFTWSWLRMSKSPFTTAQEAILPPTLSGQDFTVYRASDLALLGASDNDDVWLLPDASGNGRHAILVNGTVSYQSDTAPAGILGAPGRLAGMLGYDPTTEAPIQWSDNKVFHFRVYPSEVATNQAVFSMVDSDDFIGGGVVATKHILSINVPEGGWGMMSGDGSAGAHLYGGTPAANVDQRVTEWVQIAAGNEKMWEDDDVAPVINASSGDNPFGWWSLLLRESDERPLTGRLIEAWFVEGTGVTEADIDSARDVWLNGLSLDGVLFQKAPTFPTGAVTSNYDLTGTLFQKAPTFPQGAVTSTVDLDGVLFAKAPTFPPGILTQEGGPQPLGGVLFAKAPIFPQGAVTTGAVNLAGALFQKAPTFPTGSVAAGYDLAGTLFQSTSVFPQGAVTADQTLTGILFSSAPVFPIGTIGVAGELTGVLYQNTPLFFTGAMAQVGGSFWRPDPAAYTVNPAAYTPVGPGDVPPWPIEVHGELFQNDPLFPVGAVS